MYGAGNQSNGITTAYNRIAVNYQYLSDAFKAFGDKPVTAYLTTSSSPFKLVSGNTTMVLMPMFVQWGDFVVKPTPRPITEPETIEEDNDDLDTSEVEEIDNDNGIDNEELARERELVNS